MPRLPATTCLRLAAFYAAFFAVIGTIQPFWPLWLAARELDASEIGLVLAIGILAKVIGLPIAAHVADRSGERRRPMLILAVASALAFALFAAARTFWPIVLVSLFFFPLWPPVMSLAESLTMAAARDDGFEYGRVRLWGSLAYIFSALVAGVVIVRTSVDATFWLILAGILTTTLTCALLPDLRAERSVSRSLPVLDLLRQGAFVRMLIACGLVQGSHAVYYAFGTIHWQSIGYSETIIGALWAEGVVCEVALFAVGAAAVRWFGAAGLIGVAGLASGIRWLGAGSSDTLSLIVFLQALHALSFGAAHLGAMHWISRNIAPALSASAQSLYSAVVFGLFLGTMIYAAGLGYATLAGQAYWLMAISGFAGAACIRPLLRRDEPAFA
ncbi:MAG: MFS transporter [Rhodospirillales bacterium]|nr:MFS transporter [Rhodospirillales bacterium]